MNKRLLVAQKFGHSLDNDDFKTVQGLLSSDCIYDIGHEQLIGPKNITSSYEQNMLAGRKKMDKLEWGQSSVRQVDELTFIIHFTDYLFHKGEQYTHRCQQRVFTNNQAKIYKIEHIHDKAEQHRLLTWYASVGIPTANR